MQTELVRTIRDKYVQSGLIGVYAFLKRHDIPFEKQIIDFGLHTNQKAKAQKAELCTNEPLVFHYYNQQITHNNYRYNRIRAIRIVLLDEQTVGKAQRRRKCALTEQERNELDKRTTEQDNKWWNELDK